MEWEMWRSVLLVLLVVGSGGRHVEANGMNKDVFTKLCKIAKGVRELIGKDSVVTGHLDEALYGDKERARFNEDGSVTVGTNCGLSLNHRSHYCSHIEGGGIGFGGSGKPGCFADSLFGGFICLCTKGGTSQEDLCGFNNLGSVGSWSSWRGDGHEQNLFKTVWSGVKKKCFKDNTVDLETLKNAVEGIRGKDQQQNGKYYVTLGGGTNTNGICSGTNPGDVCVTYEGSSSGIPIIPWADKILTAITTFKEAIQRQTSPLTSATQTSVDHPENPSDPEPAYEQEGEEEEYGEPEENHDPQNLTKPPRPKRKRRNTDTQPTEQQAERLRAILHDDGSYLPKPFWLLSAVFIL